MKIQHLIVIIILLTACNADKNTINTIEISGEVECKEIKNIIFYPLEYLAEDKSFVQNIKVNRDGRFKINYSPQIPTSAGIFIEDKKYMIFLEPGKDLNFKIHSDFSIDFGKDNYKNNSVFQDYQVRFSPFFYSKLNYRLDPKSFAAQIDSISDMKKDFLERNKNKISKSLFEYIENDIIYFSAKEKIYYSRRYARDLIKNEDGYFDFLKFVEINNIKATKVLTYLSFIENYINYLYLDKIFKGNVENKNDYVEKYYIAKSVLKGETLEQFLIENLVLGIGWGVQKDKFNKIVKEFLADNYSEGAKNIVRRKISAQSKLSEGKLAPDFSLKDTKGKIYSLADFKKQYLVLDFWASWCGPCKRAIPEIKKMSDKYKDKAQFIFISIDNNQSDWKKVNDELNIYQPSLIIDSLTRENYGFNTSVSVPFYIVVDSSGKIVQSKTTKEQIEMLLK